ncbi:MAG: DNA helicase RecQ, partial [Peptococcaceae bacterium]|nr:DNA helicase RecQ [Peptococcaceae bacterium]
AECILLFSPQDVQIQRYLIENSIPSAERRDSEYKKLQYIVNYCHTSRCLRGEILQYFGQKNSPKYCDNCSNCNNTGEFIDITVEAQKILSCAWRMKGQFGVTMLAGVLKGSKNKKLLQYGLNGLSSYGLLHNYTLKEIQHLVKVLIAEKYLCLTEGRYPIVKLLPGAAPVLKGEQRVFHRKRVKKHKEIANQPLFEQLRQLRLQIAQKERVPPYVVFPDSTLREMCEQLPADTSALLTIKGVGETRLKNYGQFFLEVLRSYVGGKNKTSSTNMQPGTEQENQTASHVITYNMYKEGKTIDEIARLRDLKAVTIQNHIIRCDREGYHINWNDFIDPQYEQLILGQVKKVGANRLKLIKDELPEEIDYFSIRAVICKFGFNTSPK